MESPPTMKNLPLFNRGTSPYYIRKEFISDSMPGGIYVFEPGNHITMFHHDMGHNAVEQCVDK